MRRLVAVWVAWCVWAACDAVSCTAAAAQTSLPYKAYVAGRDVYVRSGPGEQYYPTEKLQPGAEVEVYREDPGGWLAIRPLPESYSWISGRFLKPSRDGLAEVTTQGAVARVGSQFSDIREVVQVHLDRGEVVEVKATKQMGAGDNATTWCKITPPSGEFRWVHAKYLTSTTAGRSTNPIRDTAAASRQTGVGENVVRSERPSVPSTHAGGQAAIAPAVAPRQPSGGGVQLPAGGLQLPAGGLQLPAGSVRQMSPEGFENELDDINTELSIMLAEEPTVWYCDEMQQRCESLMAQAETALERGRARALIGRIAQAGDIKRRIDGDDASPKPASIAAAARGPVPGSAGSEVRGTGRSDDRYDGSGRLARVTPSKVGAPRYALLDGRGDVLYYVSPAPGVNMQYYVGQEVGVNGQQGYIADGGVTHIMAKHVTALDSQLR
jgi:uncharacterized protein YgiM (DUF1202 family)